VALSAMMALPRNSGNVPPVLSDRRSLSSMDKPHIKLAFFLEYVSTCSSTYCAKWLNNLE
jgi:hypothetical protein